MIVKLCAHNYTILYCLYSGRSVSEVGDFMVWLKINQR